MKQLEIENGGLPSKRVELIKVPSTPCVQPKGIKSVEKTSDSVNITVTGRSSSHIPPKKKLTRQLVFTEFGLSPVIATSPPFPMQKLSSEMNLSPRSPFSSNSKSSDSPIPWVNIKANNGTPKGPKQCGCKQSKCLKLYCDCFASGEYCNGCICCDCCNNVENEDLRKAASEVILERNPHAFKPKISSSPCSPRDVEGDKMDAPQVGRHERGCHCKKSECLKRYCECFQANVFCSQNCKCVDCKNFDVCKEFMSASCEEDSKTIICKNSNGCEGRIAISPMDNTSMKFYKSFKGSRGIMTITGEDCIDSKIYIHRVITSATSDAAGLSGQLMSQESRKRKLQELHPNEKKSPSQSFSDLRKVIKRSSCPSSTLSVEPTCHIINSAMVGSFRDPYRLKLANVYHLLETRKVCSGLAILAEAAAVFLKCSEPEVKEAEENKNGDILVAKEDDYRGGRAQVQERATDDLNIGFDATDVPEGRALPPGILRLICNEKLKRFMEPTSGDQILNRNLKNAYSEKEKSVLSSFLDFLEKLIISQNMKVDDALMFPFCYLLCASGKKISSHQAGEAKAVPTYAEDRN
ncbi:protein tesmin/TSO1-like CXC 7 [Hibiscus syriacus]|uniref:protein tesmin/TSO1-like CXC 7 n=1 Tax=Hibiscus syriacus TaxID=106335 RepID=UPI0019219DA8|nr:protein tesmin/TSO1-like CXC 7 [Hibiscus syriacus]